MEQNSLGLQQHFNLKWNNHTNNFLQVFAEHQNQEALVDVTLTCEGHYISAHKLVLSACSDYFRTIFRIHNNVQHPFIILNGIRFKDLKYILNFMYLGEVKVLETDLPNVLALGENLQVKGLSAVKLVDNNEAKPSEIKQKEGVTKTEGVVKNGEHEKVHNFSVQKATQESSVVVPLTTPHGSIVPNTQRTKVTVPTNKESAETEPPFKKIMLSKQKLPKITENVQETPEVPLKSKAPSENIGTSSENNSQEPTVPGPPNAFMMFVKEWRDKLMAENPGQDSKSVSVLLGNKWKSITPATKQGYIEAAKRAEEEHRARYPNYYAPTRKRRNSADSCMNSENEKRPIINIIDDD